MQQATTTDQRPSCKRTAPVSADIVARNSHHAILADCAASVARIEGAASQASALPTINHHALVAAHTLEQHKAAFRASDRPLTRAARIKPAMLVENGLLSTGDADFDLGGRLIAKFGPAFRKEQAR